MNIYAKNPFEELSIAFRDFLKRVIKSHDMAKMYKEINQVKNSNELTEIQKKEKILDLIDLINKFVNDETDKFVSINKILNRDYLIKIISENQYDLNALVENTRILLSETKEKIQNELELLRNENKELTDKLESKEILVNKINDIQNKTIEDIQKIS
jgi:hypothetical protein